MSEHINQDDIDIWCDTHLPDIYDNGMFDSEEIHDDVWDAVTNILEETVLAFIEDEDERDATRDRIMDTATDWFLGHHEVILQTALPPLDADAIAAIQSRPQVAQHSDAWHDRRNKLSASEFAQILDGRRTALLRQKLAPEPVERPGAGRTPVAIAQPDGEMNATLWGHRFETITRRIYELEIAGVGTVCDSLGSFRHASVPWLSASPDGLVVAGPLAGRLVEIKSPKTRVPGDFVPEEYYIQMQLQMEVLNLEAVEFVEARFCQRPVASLSPEDHAAIAAAAWKGRIAVFGHIESPDTWMYQYSDPVEDLEDAAVTMPPPPADLPCVEESVWWLTSFHPRTVLRNRTWWDTVGWPAAQTFWAELESLRSAGLMPEGSPRVSRKTAAAADDTDVIELLGGGWAGRG